ncbi:MAG: MFS transporter [Kiloniellales bacterium]
MPPSRTNWTNVAFGLCLAFFAAYQFFKLPPVLPVLLATYGYDRTLAGAFMSIYALAGLLLSFGFGRIIERYGWGGLLQGGLVLLGLGNLLALIWPHDGWVMLTARGLEGIGFAVLAVVGPTMANRHAAPRHLPIIIGFTAAWIPVGQLTATILAPALLAIQGWQSLWILGLVGCPLFAVWSHRQARNHLAMAGSVRTAGAQPDTPEDRDPTGHRLLLLAAVVFVLWAGQFFAYMTWLPQYLVEVHGFGVTSALAGYAVPVSILIAFNLLTGVLLRFGMPLGALLVGALALQVAVWWLIPVTGGGWSGVLSLVAYGVGAGITPTCLFAMPSVAHGQGGAGASAFGILMTGRNVGVLFGPILLAEAFRLSGSWDLASPIFGVVTALALICAVWLALEVSRARRDSPV